MYEFACVYWAAEHMWNRPNLREVFPSYLREELLYDVWCASSYTSSPFEVSTGGRRFWVSVRGVSLLVWFLNAYSSVCWRLHQRCAFSQLSVSAIEIGSPRFHLGDDTCVSSVSRFMCSAYVRSINVLYWIVERMAANLCTALKEHTEYEFPNCLQISLLRRL